MTADEAREQADDVRFLDRYIGINNAIDVASDEGVSGIVVKELPEKVIDLLNNDGFRTLTMHGNTTILW